MKAFGNKVLINPEIYDKSPGGIIIPQMGLTSMAPTKGTVVSVGPLCEELKEGDMVLFPRGTGLDIKDPETNAEYLIMREEDVHAVVL